MTSTITETRNNGEAFSITSFTLGVYSIVSGNLLAAIVGLILGIMARKRVGVNKSLNMWGIILSSVALGVAILILFTIIILLFFFFTSIIVFLESF